MPKTITLEVSRVKDGAVTKVADATLVLADSAPDLQDKVDFVAKAISGSVSTITNGITTDVSIT